MCIPGTSLAILVGYPDLMVAATELRVGDLGILVASLEDIIRSKETSDRPKDRLALGSSARYVVLDWWTVGGRFRAFGRGRFWAFGLSSVGANSVALGISSPEPLHRSW
jgi:hypothetical protein